MLSRHVDADKGCLVKAVQIPQASRPLYAMLKAAQPLVASEISITAVSATDQDESSLMWILIELRILGSCQSGGGLR